MQMFTHRRRMKQRDDCGQNYGNASALMTGANGETTFGSVFISNTAFGVSVVSKETYGKNILVRVFLEKGWINDSPSHFL